ncbi:MAG: hypothetical protein EOP85_00365 [Verrucomicrobiaceae bacterium]|nr:MAG: hypothetical protein EOP85_00365 [Verrucomicrobiaceae bacterium]
MPEDVEKAASELIAALDADIKELIQDDNMNKAQQVRQQLRQVQGLMRQNNVRDIDNWMANFDNFQPSEKVEPQMEAFRKALKESNESLTRDKISNMEDLLASAAETVVRAEQPEDLDTLLETLSKENNNDGADYDSNNREIRMLNQKISYARQFVINWQDYLQASNSGNTVKAVQALRSISSNERSLIPRSQIIARIEHEQGNDGNIYAIADQVRKPEDMRNAIRKLAVLAAASRGESDNAVLRETLQTLAKMEKAYQEYQAGLPVSMEVFSTTESGSGVEKPGFVEVRAALLLMMLPRALNLPEGLVPAQGETVEGFLSRALKESTAKGDVAASVRVGSIRRLISRSTNESDLDALRAYAAGQQQLAAGQYALAVTSLQNSIKSGNDDVPVAKAGEMLDAIRKAHPEEFKQGMDTFHNPPPSSDPEFMRNMQREYSRHHMMFGDMFRRHDMPGATTNLVLPVPAAEKAAPAKEEKSKERPVPTAPTAAHEPPKAQDARE